MRKPVVGDEILFHSTNPDMQSVKATVIYVHADKLVDVEYEVNGKRYTERSVAVAQDAKPSGTYAAWPATPGHDWPDNLRPTPADQAAADKQAADNAAAAEKARLAK